jgi:hypothetical protein
MTAGRTTEVNAEDAAHRSLELGRLLLANGADIGSAAATQRTRAVRCRGSCLAAR